MKPIRIINVLTLIFTITVNVLANSLPINNQTTGEISDKYPVLFTPAGYVFAIWGLIYLGLISFAIYQALPAQKNNKRLDKIGPWFSLANIFNGIWIFFWHYDQVALSMIAMLGLLVSLLMIYQRLEIGKSIVSPVETAVINAPFSLYLGWISVATIANLTVLLYILNWNGFGISPEIWTVVVLAVGAVLGILMIFRRMEIVYPFVLIWAFAGIQYKSSSPALVATAAGTAAILILLALLYSFFRSRQNALVEARKNRDKLV